MSELPAPAQQILDGRMPERMRQAVAGGAVPMPPVDLVSSLAVLVARDSSLRARAVETLRELPDNVRQAALEAELAAPVFRVLARQLELDTADRERLVLNTATPDEVIADLAAAESESRILEIIAGNQTRILRHVPIVEALLENPSLGPAMKARIEEFFSRAYAGKVLLQSGRKTREELEAEDAWDDSLDEAATEPDTDEVPEDLLGDDDESLDEEAAAALLEAAEQADDGESTEEDEGKIPNLRKALATMTVGQKIKLALLGGKEARSLLIFDANKVVSALVLKNPLLSETEVEAIAKSKSVRDDILRAVARDRRFMKSYSVKVALINNPKTPPTLALQLMPQMRENDLKKLAKSKGVSGAVQQQARRMLMKKGG